MLLDHGVPHDIESKDGKTCEDMTESDSIMKIIEQIEGREYDDDDEDDDDIYDDDDDNIDAGKDEL